MIRLFLKRVITNKIYWVAVVAAFLLLLCSIVYTDPISGERYTFLSLYYKEEMKTALTFGEVSIKGVLLGYDTSYLWMFAPIITGIPCILTQKTERFVLFRSGKNRYFLSKYLSNLIAGGLLMVSAYLLFALAGTLLVHWLKFHLGDLSEFAQQNTFISEVIWDSYLLKKLLSVFCWGMVNAVWGIGLSEYIKNRYLILCIPFVWNYFLFRFFEPLLPFTIRQYISISNYEMLFLKEPKEIMLKSILLLAVLLVCGILIKFTTERRCDCGQK